MHVSPVTVDTRHQTVRTARAKSKAASTMLVTNALMKKDRPVLEANALATTAHQTLTGQELRQRAAVHVVQHRAEKQQTSLAKYAIAQLKTQVKAFEDRSQREDDDTPELVKLFTMVTGSGMFV